MSDTTRTFSGCYQELQNWNYGYPLTNTGGDHWIHETVGQYVDDYYFDLQVASDGKSITGTWRDVQNWPDGSYGQAVGVLNLPALLETCSVPPLSPVTGIAAQFEAAAPNAPGFSLIAGFNGVDPPVDELIALLQSAVGDMYGFVPPRTSGFRPPEYQAHFYELRTKLAAVRNELLQTPNNVACQELEADILTEIEKHGIGFCANGLPCVNPPGLSLHERNPALAVDLGGVADIVNTATFRGLLRTFGIALPPKRDLVHFRLDGSVDPRTFSVVVASPVNVLVRDPLGRRLGADPIL